MFGGKDIPYNIPHRVRGDLDLFYLTENVQSLEAKATSKETRLQKSKVLGTQGKKRETIRSKQKKTEVKRYN